MQYKNDLFLRTAMGETVERPPVWLMRQAGRILPQYKALRAKLSGFKELVETPTLAAEVTIQPIDELDVDAAIIFSDILVIPEAMGLPYELIEKKGPFFPRTIQSAADIDALIEGEAAAHELQYVYEALKLTKQGLGGRVPLIGFCGAPWTILCYMIEGSGSKTFSKARRFLYQEPELAHRLLQKITSTSIAYLKLKAANGADLLQIFDSWAGILPADQYNEFALPYIRQMCDAITEVPKTVFAKGAWASLEEINQLNCNVVGLDWNIRPAHGRAVLGADRVVQGNLDPCLLYADAKTIESSALNMVKSFGSKHIVNLGHGVYPDTPLENVKVFVNTIKSHSY